MNTDDLNAISDTITLGHFLLVSGAYARCSCGVEFYFPHRDLQHRRHRDERFANALGLSTATLPISAAPTPIARRNV